MAAQDPDKVSDSCNRRHLPYRPPHPLSFRQADSIASDRCRATGARRLGGRQELNGRIPQGSLDQRRGGPFTGDARLDRFEQGGSGGRHTAADNHASHAQRQGERSDRPGQMVGDAVGDLDRHDVARGAGPEDVGGTRMRRQDRAAASSHRLVGLAADRRTGGDRLQTAAQTACADGSIRIGDDVAHLAREAVVTAEHRSIEDDTGRDARPDRQEGDARRGRGRPVRPTARSARARPPGRRARRNVGTPSSASSIGPSGR
jgi:hypothetical protein